MVSIKKSYVDVSLGQIHFAHVAGTGTPIVFFHQTASNWEMWEKAMGLIDLPNPLYAFDTPGFGGSFDPEGEADMADYAGWMAEALAALGIASCHVVGHHTGAAIATELACRRPELAASLTAFGPLTLTAEEREESAKHYGAPFVPARSGAYLLQNWEYLRVGGADAEIDLLHREMVGMLRAWKARPQAYGAVWKQDFIAAFKALTCPIRIVCPTDDVLYPFFERARELRPDADAVVLDAGSNFSPDIAPEAVTAAIRGHVLAVESALAEA